MNPAGANYPMKISPKSQRYSDARDALEAAMAGEDITGGATHFWGPKAQEALGRNPPSWSYKAPGVDIGETRFHKLERAEGGEVEGYAGGGDVIAKALAALRGGNKVFPKPQRMFPADARPPGGEYINAATGEAMTGQKPARAVLGVTPEGKPAFLTDPEQVDVTGSPGKGSTKTMTNLFRRSAGWDWRDAPEGYENVPMIVSTKNRNKHYYSLGADYPKGVDLARYPNETSEPRLKPTTQGNVYPGEQVGTIVNKTTGDEHPVYDMVTIRNMLAGTGAGAAGAAAMPEDASADTEILNRYAHGGLVDDALHVVREHHADGEGVGQAPVATDNSERVRAAESAANLARQIQAYEASMASIRQQPQDIQSMTHAPEKPRAPISVEALGKNREFGSAPYDVAGPLSSFAQGAYDMKTLPLYMYPPTAPLGMAIDTAEGMASGSPTQVAMGALGGPLKVARNVIAPLAVATGVTAPDEAEAGSLSKLFGKMVSPAKRAENLVKFKAGNVEDVPSVVYHGTGNDIHQFDTTKGAWFTDTPSLASEYANKPGGNVVPAHIALKNPIEFVHAEQRKPIGEVISTALSGARDLSAEQINAAKPIVDVLRKRYGKDARPLFEYWNNDPDVTKLFKTLGYDGISAFEKADRKAKTWSIFSPEQAKSAIGNAGTFDPTKARLNEAKGGSVEDRALMLVSRQA